MTITEAPNRLAELRQAAALTQQEVASRLGAPVTAGQVSRWERGEVAPSLRYRRLLAGVFGVGVADLGLPDGRLPVVRSRSSAEDFYVGDEQDQRVLASQDEWRATRQRLNGNRHRLSQVAAGLYPQARLDGTGLIAGPGWIPEQPVDLAEVMLTEDAGGEPTLDGTEQETTLVRPLQSLTRPYPRYTTAVRDLARPRLFEDRLSWRLAGLDWTGGKGSMGFGETTYFGCADVFESVAHELAYAALDEAGGVRGRVALRDLPYRRLIGDPFDLSRRPVMPAISTLTIRRDGERAEFLMHRRDPRAVAAAGGMLQVIPSGIFQPSSILPAARAADFDLWRNIQREFAEELLGVPECDGHGRPVDYGAGPFAVLDQARASGAVRVHCLGVALDALTLVGEILTVLVVDASVFDQLAGDFVEHNDEGRVEAERFAFTEAGVSGLFGSGRVAPAGAGCLTLAWKWRETLLDR